MLDELTEYFRLVSRYKTASPEIQKAIVRIALPKLRDKAKSNRLKEAIDKFIAGTEPAQKLVDNKIRGR